MRFLPERATMPKFIPGQFSTAERILERTRGRCGAGVGSDGAAVRKPASGRESPPPGASSSPLSRRRPFLTNQMVPVSQRRAGTDKNSRRGRVGAAAGAKWTAIEKAMAESAAPMATNFRAKSMLKAMTKARSRKLGVFMPSRYRAGVTESIKGLKEKEVLKVGFSGGGRSRSKST